MAIMEQLHIVGREKNGRVFLLKGDTEQLYQLVNVSNFKPHRQWFSLSCLPLCGLNLHRPHLTCLFCLFRLVLSGKVDPLRKVQAYLIMPDPYRKRFLPLAFRQWLAKKVLVIYEYLLC